MSGQQLRLGVVRAFCRAVDVVLQDSEHVRPALDTRLGSVPVLGQVYLLDHVIRAAGMGESVKTQKNHLGGKSS